jgi:hypothetical protein
LNIDIIASPFLIMTRLSLCPYNLIVLYSDERSEGEYKFNYIYWVRSFGFGDVHFIVRLLSRDYSFGI